MTSAASVPAHARLVVGCARVLAAVRPAAAPAARVVALDSPVGHRCRVVFVIFGEKDRTEPVPGGLSITKTCPKCERVASFRERIVSKRFRLYFVEMFTHGTHHVLECSECGTTFVTDEVRGIKADNDQSGTVYGRVQGVIEEGKRALESGKDAVEGAMEDGRVSEALQQAESLVDGAVKTAQQKVGGLLGGLLSGGDKSKK